MLYKVTITETCQRVIAVEANNPVEAHQRASDAWKNSEVILTDKDFDGVEFHVNGVIEDARDIQQIERKDCI